MDIGPDKDSLFKWYLLGATSPEEDQQIEQSLQNENLAEELLLVEEDLIDDYARGLLAPYQRELFEQNFLSTPDRLQNLALAQAAVRYSAKQFATELAEEARPELLAEPAGPEKFPAVPVPSPAPLRDWRWAVRVLYRHRWRIAPYALLVMVIAIGVWRWPRQDSELARGLRALSKAFPLQRPTEARMIGFPHAVWNITRGGKAGGQAPAVDQGKLREAERLLTVESENEDSDALYAQGKLHLAKREFDLAIEYFEKALSYQENDARTHSDLGAALVEKLKNSGDRNKDWSETVNKAFSHLDRALELDGNLLEPLFNRALLYQLQNLNGPAQEAWKKYLEKDPNSPWADEARSYLKDLQQKSSNSGDQRSEGLYRDFTNARAEGNDDRAWRLYNDGYSHYGNYILDRLIDEFLASSTMGKQREAEDRIQILEFIAHLSEERSQDLFINDLVLSYRQANRSQLAMLALGRRLRRSAESLYNKAKYQEVIEIYLEAKSLFTQAHAPPEVITLDYWIAEARLRQSKHNKSIEGLLSVVSECERNHYRWLRALAFNRIAGVLGDQSSYSEALRYCLEAGDEFSRIGDKSGQLRALMNQASLNRYMGKYRDAIYLCQKSLVVLRNEVVVVDPRWVPIIYAIAGWSFSRLRLYSAALEFQKESLRMVEEQKITQAISRYSISLGGIYGRMKDYDTAIAYIERGLNIGRQDEDSAEGQEMINYALLYLGQVYRESGRPAEAIKVHKQAAEFYRKSGWEAQSYLIAKEILLDQIALGEISAAEVQLDIVLGLLEEHRKKILQQSYRNSFFDMEQGVYDIAIGFAYEMLDQPEQAFNYSELSRARSLLDSATLTRQIVNDVDIPEEVLSGSTRPMTIAEIQRRLPQEAQILQYAVLKDHLVAWIVTKDRVESRTIPLDAEHLSIMVNAYLGQVSKPAIEVDQNLRKMSAGLYESIITPVENYLDKKRKLCIVPDKILNLLPYSSLISPHTGKYLIEEYSLLFAPSSTLFIRSTLNAGRRAGKRKERLLSLGNPVFDRSVYDLPDLSSARTEVQEISSIYGAGRSLIGNDATKKTLLKEIERSDVVHLATHYLPVERSPMLSRLILAKGSDSKNERDSILALHEVYGLKLPKARLVVLSACQTNAEQYYDGEGSMGLSYAFESVGVPLIVSSLWQVNSDTTANLMVRFHHLRKMAGESTIDALRKAQIEMLNGSDQRLHHPYYWSAFIVTGGYSRF